MARSTCRPLARVLAILLAGGFGSSASLPSEALAQEAAAAPEAAAPETAAPPSPQEQEPGTSVTISDPSGIEMTISWQLVERVEIAPAAPPQAPGAAAPPSAPKEGRGRAPVPPGAVIADPAVDQQGMTVINASGKAYPIPKRRFWDLNMVVGGSAVFGMATKASREASIYGGGLDLGMNVLLGQVVPGTTGGIWNGAVIQPMFGVYGSGEVGEGDSKDDGAGGVMLMGHLAFGYEFLYLGQLKVENLRQNGFGFTVCYQIGFQWMQIWGDPQFERTGSAFSHGPLVWLLFPEIHNARGELSTGYIGLEVHVMSEAYLTYFILSGGSAFL
jgi:hypothetical protein